MIDKPCFSIEIKVRKTGFLIEKHCFSGQESEFAEKQCVWDEIQGFQ